MFIEKGVYMANISFEDKLEQFARAVYEEAEKQRKTTLENIEEKYNEACIDCEKETSDRYKRRYEEQLYVLSGNNRRKIVEAQATGKRKLIIMRNKYLDQLFNAVLIKLEQYFNSAEYEIQLLSLVDQYKIEGQVQTVYLVERDMHLKERLETEKGVNVIQSDVNFMGGLKITIGDMRIADCSFKTRFEEERSKFNKIRIYQ